MQRKYRYTLTEPEGRNFDPEFKPDLSPKEMLALGVFAGKYMTGCRKEFPAARFTHARLAKGTATPISIISASMPAHRSPIGSGRAGSTKTVRRHVAQLKNACDPGDLFCGPRQRQALLHWAYDSRKL